MSTPFIWDECGAGELVQLFVTARQRMRLRRVTAFASALRLALRR